MKKRFLSLILAVMLVCVLLPTAAFAAEGKPYTVISEEQGLSYTLDGYLRTETHYFQIEEWLGGEMKGGRLTRYLEKFTFYIVEDSSSLLIKALPGFNYYPEEWDPSEELEEGKYVTEWISRPYLLWDAEGKQFCTGGAGGAGIEGLNGPYTETVTRLEEDGSLGLVINDRNHFALCESDYNKLRPVDPEDWTEAIPAKYHWAQEFSEGLAAVSVDSGEEDEWGGPIYKWGFIDPTGKEVIPCQYNEVYCFTEGLAAVSVDSGEKGEWGGPIYKWGFIDPAGKEAVPCQYNEVYCFSEGLAAVKLDDKWGFIDLTGTEAIPIQYDWVSEPFDQGYAKVYKDKETYYIDKKGQRVAYEPSQPSQTEQSEVPQGELMPAELDGTWGYVTLKAATPAPTAYPSTQEVEVDGHAVQFQFYALEDENGNYINYIKLRDLADILNGTAAQFEVGWNGQVTITTKTAYTPNGTEQKTLFSGQRTYKEVTAQTLVNGEAKDLAAFTLTDDNGGGYTYYKLRDLGEALGIKVDWSKERGIFIETK